MVNVKIDYRTVHTSSSCIMCWLRPHKYRVPFVPILWFIPTLNIGAEIVDKEADNALLI